MVVSSVFVEETDTEWGPTELGGPKFSRALMEALDQSAKANGIPVSYYFIVQILEHDLFLIAHQTNGKLFLQSLYDDSKLHLKAGAEESAEKVIEAVKPLSQQSFDAPS